MLQYLLAANPKYGESALKLARGIGNYKELAKVLKCNKCQASTILNELLGYELYIRDSNGKLKKTKALIRVGLNPRKSQNQITEEHVRIKKIRRINFNAIEKELEAYFKNNFNNIKNPFTKDKKQSLTPAELKRASDILIKILNEELDFEDTAGLKGRFYTSFADYFSKNRSKKEEVTSAFSSLLKNFEPYLKK